MIPHKSGVRLRFFIVGLAALAALLSPADGRAQARFFDGFGDLIHPVAGTAPMRVDNTIAVGGPARPTVTITHDFDGPTGSPHEEFDLTIEFSESVTGFRLADIGFENADPIDQLSGSGSIYETRVETDAGFEGTVHVRIAANVAFNSDDDGNLGTGYSFSVDNRAPVAIGAEVAGDQLDVDFDEALDANPSSIPSGSDFSVRVTDRSGVRSNERVSRVRVFGDRLNLMLADSVQADDEVELIFRNLGVRRLQDATGNYAEGFGHELEVTNRTETGTETPGPPRTLDAEEDGLSVIDLDWRAPLDDGDDEVTGYRIEVSADEGDKWSVLVRDTDNTRTSYSHVNLDPGTTRHYRVAAINRFGVGAYSNVAHATTETQRVPYAPTRLTAAARGTSSIVLDWRAPGSGSAGPITGYRIEVSTSRTSGWQVLELNAASRSTSYTHSGLAPGSTRYYRVSAINRAGRGDPSDVASATTDVTTPGIPTGLSAVPSGLGGSRELLLTWTRPSSDGGRAITGYRIERSPNGFSAWTVVMANTRSSVTNFRHTGLTPGTTYHYRVAAINAVGTGSYSNTARGTTNAAPPGPPASLSARANGPNSITLTWQPPLDNGGARVTGYRIRGRGPHDGTWITLSANTGSTATTFTHTGLQPVTAYRYQVAAINSVGAGAWSLETRTATPPDVPGAPTNLTARAVGTSRIDLTWSAPSNDRGAPVIGYRIEQSNDGRSWRSLRSNTGTTATRFSHENLQPATTRYYRVSAINSQGFGAVSNVVRATTEATVPGAPRNFRARADGTSEIDLSWQAPATDGGASIEGYRIEVSDNAGGTWNTLVPNTRTARTSYSHTGLAPATTRHYRVSAINRIGAGQPSRVASATTDATVPDPPTGLTATATMPTQIDLSWTAPAYNGGAEISGYRIEVSETGQNWVNLVANSGSASTNYAHTGLLPGSQRFYRVSAINVAGTGMPSGVASAATDDPVQRAGRLNTRVLPHVAAAMTSSTVAAIADRVDAAANGRGFERRMDMGGLSSMAASFGSQGMAGTGPGRNGRSDLLSLFGGASFQMPIGAANAPQQAGSGGQLATWGAGEYHHLGEPGEATLDWSGNMVSAHVGADTRVAPDILTGVAASYSTGTFDFTDRTGAAPVEGTYGTAMTSVNPYVAWFPGLPGSAAWATAGFGWGDLEVEDDREALRSSPARMITGAAGGSYRLLESGFGGIRVKAEGWAGRVLVDGSERVDSVTLDMQRARLALEWTQGYRSAGGDEVALVVEGAMRYDNGDGVNGAGAEVGGGLRYSNADLGLMVEGRGRLLVSGREGYEEWGFGGRIQLDPAARGQGLQIRLAPSYGDAASGVDELWDRGVNDAVREWELDMGANVDGEVAYGLAGFRGTPYTGFRLAESGARAFSSGLRYELGSGLGVRIEGTRHESVLGAAEHTVGIRGRVRLR